MTYRRQALGVIAYAEAFQATLAKIRRPHTAPDQHVTDFSLDTFDFTHLRESIKVANETGAWHRQGIFAVTALTFTSTLSLCAFWVSASRLAEERHWVNNSVFPSIIRWVFLNQGLVLGLVISVIVVLWDVIYSDRSKTEILFKTFISYTWPGRRPRIRAGRSLYFVTLVVAFLLLILLDFQFGLRIL